MYKRKEEVNPIKPRRKGQSVYTHRKATKLCLLIANGQSINRITKDPKHAKWCPTRQSIFHWSRDIPEFKTMLDMAYICRADHYIDKLYELMDDVETGALGVKEAGFVAEQIKWIGEKIHPRYAKSIESNNPQVNIAAKEGSAIQIILADKPKEITDGSEVMEASDVAMNTNAIFESEDSDESES